MKLVERGFYIFLVVFIAVFSASGLIGDVIEPDSALYASIAKHMVLSEDWANLFVRGADWLDKPHLTFWLAALSFKIFGISAFAYKLPSFIIGLLGAWYLYKLAKSIFEEQTALISVIIFLTSLHVIISTFDVRAEIYITTFTLASIYHYYKAHFKGIHIIAGSFFAACAIMVKGIFILIPVFAGFIIYWTFTKQLKEILKVKWWLALIFIFIFILPELYTLYVQFDLHPEKIVFGKNNTSGLMFFFYDSQFGRFFNNGPIQKSKGDISFFLHTLIWAFLPWSILLYTAVIGLLKKKNRIVFPKEIIFIWGSATVTFLLFSFSSFQLPHYIIIIFPQLSIITALYLKRLNLKSIRRLLLIQNSIFILVMILLIGLAVLTSFEYKYLIISFIVVISIIGFFLFREARLQTILGRSVLISFCLAIFLNFYFYPSILKYQAGMHAAKWAKQYYPHLVPSVFMFPDSFSFDFYAKGEVKYFWSYEDLAKVEKKNELILYVSANEFSKISKIYPVTILKQFEYFHITRLKPKFLNANTRNSVLENFYLIKLK